MYVARLRLADKTVFPLTKKILEKNILKEASSVKDFKQIFLFVLLISHLYPEMNASIVSENFVSYWAFTHYHILHIWYNFVCFGEIS